MTEELKAKHLANLAKGRETAKRNREEKQRMLAAQARERAAPTPEPDPPEVFAAPIIAEGGVPAEAELPVSEETLFDRFVQALDRETRELLDEQELREIYDAQQTKARAERRASAKKAAAEQALMAARIAEGVLSPQSAEEVAWHKRMNEMVDFTIELPQLGGIPAPGVEQGPVDIGLRIDQRIFMHGNRYPMTRAQYDSYRDIIYRAQQNELRFEGKGRGNWLTQQALGSVERQIN